MIKPLLKVIPTLSGNCKLGCELNEYEQVSDNEYIAISRIGHIFPLGSNLYNKKCDVSFLNGSWEYDISKFFNSGYSDIFFKDTFTFDKQNILDYNSTGDVIRDRNTDIEFGCKRVSYDKSGYQLAFFAPFYCDNVNDLPDYFEITVKLHNTDMYSTTKKIKVDLTNKKKQNYLYKYIQRYFSKVDDNVIYMMPASSQALYYGIDALNGGFNKYIDNIISKVYTTETTINGYDACVTKGFQRNNLVIKQIMPLSFYFNINDILTESERKQYNNAELYIKGEYYKDNEMLSFYMIDDNYDYLSLQVLTANKITGSLKYQHTKNNILGINDNLSLDTVNIEEYKFSNKLNKTYNRWKLKYSDDEHPYIINTNINFSKNQKLNNLYYQYPQNYYYMDMMCEFTKNGIDLKLPLGKNINTFYKDNNEFIVNKYILLLSNYINNWFDMSYSLDIKSIINNTKWSDIHSTDNKVLYNGLLYDFNNIYTDNNIYDKIDKFAILFYIDDSTILDNTNINNNIVTADYTIDYSNSNTSLNLAVNANTNNIEGDSLYNFNSRSNSVIVNTNVNFSYNTNGSGKYVDISDLGIDYYEVNKYIPYDVIDILNNAISNKIPVESLSVVEGYELMSIPYIDNIFTENKYNGNYNVLLPNFDNIYYSTNNGVKNKLSADNIDILKTLDNDNKYSCIFYQKRKFVSINELNKVINNLLNKSNIFYQLDNIRNKYKVSYFIYYHKYILDNITLDNIFINENNCNKFYGDNMDISKLSEDSNVLYVDTYKLYDKINNLYKINGNTIYIKDISANCITLSDLSSKHNIYLFVNDNEQKTVLEKLDYENTYAKQSKFLYNPYNVNKFITDINSIYFTSSLLSNNIVINNHNYELLNDNLTISTSEETFVPYNDITDITCYSYNIDYKSTFVTNKIEFTDNIYKNSSYITGYYYVSNINNTEYNVVLTNKGGDNIYLLNNDKYSNERIAYNVYSMQYINDRYVPNFNGVGTYLYSQNTIIKHPKKLIGKIYNLPYLNNVIQNTKYKKCTYLISYLKNLDKNEFIRYYFEDYYEAYNVYNITYVDMYTYNLYNDYIREYNKYGISKNNKPKIRDIINFKNINNIKNNYNSKPTTKYNKLTNIYYTNWFAKYDNVKDDIITYSISDDVKFDIYKYVEENFINTEPEIYNQNIKNNNISLSKCFDEKSFQHSVSFARIKNNVHLHAFISNTYIDALDSDNKHSNNILDLLYIKNTVIEANSKISNNIDINNIFVPISKYIEDINVIDNITSNTPYVFSCANSALPKTFELYFKKSFIKLNKYIFDNIINLNNDGVYNDLYIYTLQHQTDKLRYIKYINNSNELIDYKRYSDSYLLTPLFDNVFKEDKLTTVIYKNYLFNIINEVHYYNNNVLTETLYRYNSNNRLCLINVSNIKDSKGNSYIFRQDRKSKIYDTLVKNTYTTYSYINDEGLSVDNYNIYSNNDVTYKYVASKIKTYDKDTSVQSEYVNITNTDSNIFDKYKINIYTYNGITYGFYINRINIKNINNMFSIMLADHTPIKYFTQINGVSVINNHNYITDMFKLIVPCIKTNILNKLYEIQFLIKPYKTSFVKRYSNITTDKKHIILNTKQQNNVITLYRYYDNIIPYIKQVGNINTEYILKTKQHNIQFDTNIYNDSLNIYNYQGLRIYENNDDFITYKQLEYKYYNDNKFINLETSFKIFIGNNLSEQKVIEHQETNTIIKYFKEYINKYKFVKFTDSEILFLYNKYNVIVTSISEKIDTKSNQKLYSLIYKFNLK